jgi:protein-S-isoprenylcysteine O-methyltransferase Ste14
MTGPHAAEHDIPRTRKHRAASVDVLKMVGPVAAGTLLAGIIAFLSAGRFLWTWPWVYVGINLVNVLVVYPRAMRIDPGIAARRGTARSKPKWDDVGNYIYLVATYIALPLVAGLDVRFAWTGNFSTAWHGAGAAVLTAGLALAAWAAATNAYTWSEATIQRDQTVCSAGPYRFIRHPAYAGLIVQALGVPLLLGSLWALIPGITVAVFMIIQTNWEDRTLQGALPGYRNYVRKVRFRLVPGIW